MNLLELMLSQHVLWPAEAEFAVQDYSGKIKFADKQPVFIEKYYQWEECWVAHSVSKYKRLDKWNETIITRADYQSAGGWMSWKGGERPVPKETPILYSTKTITAEPARAGACSWEHVGDDSDIIAYCLTAIIPMYNLKDTAGALATSHTIRQNADNSWHERGELPPVGCECEWHLRDRWVRAETLKHRIGPTGAPLALVMNVKTFVTQWCGKHSFRPLRTERENAIDAACKAIGGAGEDELLTIERLYDAGLLK